MNVSLDIRWKQRFQNFEKAFLFLQEGLNIQHPSALEEAGIVQAFEFTFELAWKTLKDYLLANGVDAKFPRDVVKEAFQYGVLGDGALWLAMLDKRNQLAHIYNETNAEAAMYVIRKQFPTELEALYTTLHSKYKQAQ